VSRAAQLREATVNFGVPKLNQLFNRVSLPLALLFCLVQVKPTLWAQDKEWDAHMKAGNKASMSLFKYEKAEKEFQAALARTETFPPNDLRTAETLSKLATLYTKQEKFTEAEARQKRAVAIFEASTAGPDDPRLACAMVGLALVYQFEGKREEAAPIWDRYFPILQKLARPLDPEVLSAMTDFRSELGDLETVYGRQKQDSDFEAAATTILEVDEKVFAPDSPETGNDAKSLANHYEEEFRYRAAYPLLLRSLEITQREDAKDRSVSRVHRDAATALDVVVGTLFIETGQGPFLDPHWGHQTSLFFQYKELAWVAAKSGKYPEAEQFYKQVISVEERRKYNSTGDAGDLVDLSSVYRHEHRYNDALDAIGRYKQVADELAAKEKSANYDETLLNWYSQNELAEIYREKGDLAAARPLFERSMEMIKTLSLGEADLRVAELQSYYAAFLADEGKLDEAESAYQRALNVWAQRRSSSPYVMDLGYAEALANYAALLRKLNRPAEAEPLEAQAVAIREKATGSKPVN
jgi:tetratricopeptide (TPR) repeat protein